MLEIAAGTGTATRHLLEQLPEDARLVATDLNDAMLDFAKMKMAADPRLEWTIADARALPFDEAAFDAVVCQFGLMFVPDKARALREMSRVLKPNGSLVLSVWSALGDNPIARIAHETITTFFHIDPPQFYMVPFGLHEQAVVEGLLKGAGFGSVECETVDMTGESASAELAAKGLIFGNPVINAIEERRSVPPEVVRHAVAARLSEEGGASPMRLPMRARVFTAIK